MEIELLSREENKLLGRLEVRFKVIHPEGSTPTREAIRDALTSTLKLKDRIVVVDNLNPQFGMRESRGYAKVYSSLEDASRIERRYTLLRNKLVKEEAPKVAATEEAEEAPQEVAAKEVSEEPPEETSGGFPEDTTVEIDEPEGGAEEE